MICSTCFTIHDLILKVECLLQFIISNGALPSLLNLLNGSYKKSIKKEACWTISNITAGNKGQIQVKCALLWIWVFCVWSISVGGLCCCETCFDRLMFTKQHIHLLQAVIEANIIGPLVQLLLNAEFDVKKEAAWASSNATSGGTHEQIKWVITYNYVIFVLL